jgi:hypothetical protein
VTEHAATEVTAEGLLEETGTTFPALSAPFREEGLQVFADHRVENGRLGATRVIAEGEWAAHATGGSA